MQNVLCQEKDEFEEDNVFFLIVQIEMNKVKCQINPQLWHIYIFLPLPEIHTFPQDNLMHFWMPAPVIY